MNGDNLYVPDALRGWAEERAAFRAEKNWAEADRLRNRIAATGYTLQDAAEGVTFERPAINAADDVPSQIDVEATRAWTTLILARDRDDDLRRAAESVLQHGPPDSEMVLVGNGQSATHDLMADLAVTHENVRPLYTARNLGEGPSLGAGLRAALGHYVLILGVHLELTGDAYGPLQATLQDATVGATGGWGLVTGDLMDWASSDGPDVDAIEFYAFAFRRALMREVGLPDPRFAFYRNLDLSWSLAFKDKGYRNLVTPDLPAETHEHIWYRLDEEERQDLSRKNYRFVAELWGQRHDLLVSSGSHSAS